MSAEATEVAPAAACRPGAFSFSPEQQVLLLCLRRQLNAQQSERLAGIVDRGFDWRGLLVGAQANFVVPLVARHLLPLLAGHESREFQEQLTVARNRTILRMLHVCALKRSVTENVLGARGIRFLELKGSALSAELHGDPYLRQFRDIDLLVEPGRLEEAAKLLTAAGWRVLNKEWDPTAGRDLSVLSRYQAAIELCSPTGVALELHRVLDNSGCVFDTGKMMSTAGNHPARGILRSDLHFAYMAFHHSRHRWSSLHWCADAVAFAGLPESAINDTRRAAERWGLLTTVDESLSLAHDLTVAALEGQMPGAARSKFFDDCGNAIQRTVVGEGPCPPAIEKPPPKRPDFAYAWQETPGYCLKFELSRFRPNLNDYNWMPLPENRRWIYWVTRPWRVLRN